MPLARIITDSVDDSLELSIQLRARGFQVETVAPGEVPNTLADLEVRLEECSPEDVMTRAAESSSDGYCDVEDCKNAVALLRRIEIGEKRRCEDSETGLADTQCSMSQIERIIRMYRRGEEVNGAPKDRRLYAGDPVLGRTKLGCPDKPDNDGAECFIRDEYAPDGIGNVSR